MYKIFERGQSKRRHQWENGGVEALFKNDSLILTILSHTTDNLAVIIIRRNNHRKYSILIDFFSIDLLPDLK